MKVLSVIASAQRILFSILLGSFAVTASLHYTEFEFFLKGNNTHLENFTEAIQQAQRPNEACFLKTFELKFAVIDRKCILNYLRSCHGLTEIKLESVLWKWDRNSISQERTYLPDLEIFQFGLINDTKTTFNDHKDLESIIFFYKTLGKGSTGGLVELTHLHTWAIRGRVGSTGYLNLIKGKVEARKIRENKFWNLLYQIWTEFYSILATECVLDVSKLDMTYVTEIILKSNTLQGGSIAQILRSAKAAKTLKIESLEDEAVDVALLPRQLIQIETKLLSFRWSSDPALEFTQLKELEMSMGDVDLTLFSRAPKLWKLAIDNSHVLNHSLKTIQTSIPLRAFFMSCQNFDGLCPTISLQQFHKNTITDLVFEDMEVEIGEVEKPFHKLWNLGLLRCKLSANVLRRFSILFPLIQTVVLDIEDIVRENILEAVLTTKVVTVGVIIPIGTRSDAIVLLQKRIEKCFNLALGITNYKHGTVIGLTRKNINEEFGFSIHDDFAEFLKSKE